MGRNYKDTIKDNHMLKQIKIGSRVRYCNEEKENFGLIGTVTAITKYRSCRYGYKSVTVKADDGQHINCSPRNLELCNYEETFSEYPFNDDKHYGEDEDYGNV